MWNWLNCYLSGRHDFGVWCEPGAIFLRCVHCGKRSSGWAVNRPPAIASAAKRTPGGRLKGKARIVPFTRAIG